MWCGMMASKPTATIRHDGEQADRDDRLRKRVFAALLELAGVPRQDPSGKE